MVKAPGTHTKGSGMIMGGLIGGAASVVISVLNSGSEGFGSASILMFTFFPFLALGVLAGYFAESRGKPRTVKPQAPLMVWRRVQTWFSIYVFIVVIYIVTFSIFSSENPLFALIGALFFLPNGFFILINYVISFIQTGNIMNRPDGILLFAGPIVGHLFALISIRQIRYAKNWKVWAFMLLLFWLLSFGGCLSLAWIS